MTTTLDPKPVTDADEDPVLCERCDKPETDGDPMIECIGNTSGPNWHVSCHANVCTSTACHRYNFATHDDRD